ncbi:hypothetical protein, partial [Enterococcus lactis]
SEERLTIGTKLNVAMNESPLEWNADRWEATFTRECSILVDVQTMVEFADQWVRMFISTCGRILIKLKHGIQVTVWVLQVALTFGLELN